MARRRKAILEVERLAAVDFTDCLYSVVGVLARSVLSMIIGLCIGVLYCASYLDARPRL